MAHQQRGLSSFLLLPDVIFLLLVFTNRCSADLSFGENSNVEILTGKQFEKKVIREDEPWLIMFCPNQTLCQNHAVKYSELSVQLKNYIKVGAVTEQYIFKKYNVFKPLRVRLYRGSKRGGQQDFNGDLNNVKDMFEWITLVAAPYHSLLPTFNATSRVKVFTEDEFKNQVLKGNDPWLIMFGSDTLVDHAWYDLVRRFSPQYEQVAGMLSDIVNVGAVMDPELVVKNVGVVSLPFVKFYLGTAGPPVPFKINVTMGKKWEKFDGETTALELVEKVEPFIPNPPPTVYGGESSNVKEFTGDEFEGKVLYKGETWLVVICPSDKNECRRFVPKFEKVAAQLKDQHVEVGALTDPHFIAKYNYHSFPQLGFYNVKGELKKFPGPFYAKEILDWARPIVP